MKLICVLVLTAMFAFGTSVQAQPIVKGPQHVSVLSMKNEVFYFKVDSEFIGATVKVVDSTGTVFFSIELHSKRNLIDFFYLENGAYTIRFEQGEVQEEYPVLLDEKKELLERQASYFKLQA